MDASHLLGATGAARRALALRAAALCVAAMSAQARDGAASNPEPTRTPFGPPAPGPEDIRVFPAAAPGFDQARPGVPAGRVESFGYHSATTGTRRLASVYLPPGYPAERTYPVLYLLHGIAGNQDEWRGYVRAHHILDNQIAAGRALPMIVVMPNGRARPDDRPPPPDHTFTPEHVAAFERFERDLLESLIPAIEAHYAAASDRRQRAIAGLSMGGGQALNIGLAHLDRFAWVAGFSPAPNTRAAAQLLPDAEAAKRQLALLYLSCGRQDGLLRVPQALHRGLRQRGIPHVWTVDEHGHVRESWADNLHHFVQRLFR